MNQSKEALNTAVLLLIFNRPDTTKRVFEAIRQARPPRLYIASDGHRKDREGELLKVEEARTVVASVDWPCEVRTLYREENLGCKYAVSGAIDWFFENEEMGIVIEDDCLPSLSFFYFCDEQLNRYQHDDRIGQISGINRYESIFDENQSYFFSRYGPIWGWASWRRAWTHYDVDPLIYSNDDVTEILRSVTNNSAELAAREALMQKVRNREIDTWDYQWGFAKYANHMLSIIPARNLVINIGLENGTHMTSTCENRALNAKELRFPLSHPKQMFPCAEYDRLFSARVIKPKFLRRLLVKLAGAFNSLQSRSSRLRSSLSIEEVRRMG